MINEDRIFESFKELYNRVDKIIECIVEGKKSDDVYFTYVKFQLEDQCGGDILKLQLPEPANLPLESDGPYIMTVGRNPGYHANSKVPKYTDSLITYFEYYKNRMAVRFLEHESIYYGGLKSDEGKLMTHHQFIESNFLKPLGFLYGRNAISIDANPFRSNDPKFGVTDKLVNKKLLEEKINRIKEYVNLINPKLILFLGRPGMDMVNNFLEDVTFPVINPTFVDELNCHVQCIHHPGYPTQETFWYYHRAADEAKVILYKKE